MAQQAVRRNRTASPARWQRALQRALFAGVEAKQIAGTGEWIVGSASRPGLAYRTDGIGCDCEAAMLGGDAVCLHRAAYWHAQGVLELDGDGPEDIPPAAAALVDCSECAGTGTVSVRDWSTGITHGVACATCHGAGIAPLSEQAAAAESRGECAGAGTRLVVTDWRTGAGERIACPSCSAPVDHLPASAPLAAQAVA